MNEEIEKEREKIIQEWEQRAGDDLESAEVILKQTDNYEIAVYHAHQAIEKMLKMTLLKRKETFKFVHDLNTLFKQVFGKSAEPEMLEKVSFINSLYPILRYPTGDKITEAQAEKCLSITKDFFAYLKRLALSC